MLSYLQSVYPPEQRLLSSIGFDRRQSVLDIFMLVTVLSMQVPVNGEPLPCTCVSVLYWLSVVDYGTDTVANARSFLWCL